MIILVQLHIKELFMLTLDGSLERLLLRCSEML